MWNPRPRTLKRDPRTRNNYLNEHIIKYSLIKYVIHVEDLDLKVLPKFNVTLHK